MYCNAVSLEKVEGKLRWLQEVQVQQKRFFFLKLRTSWSRYAFQTKRAIGCFLVCLHAFLIVNDIFALILFNGFLIFHGLLWIIFVPESDKKNSNNQVHTLTAGIDMFPTASDCLQAMLYFSFPSEILPACKQPATLQCVASFLVWPNHSLLCLNVDLNILQKKLFL